MPDAPVHSVMEGTPAEMEIQYNEAAFQSLFKSHFTLLCAYCQYKYRFDLDTAKEAVHTGFIKLWESRGSILAGSSVEAYLFKIVKNTCLDFKKHHKVVYQHEQYMLKQGAIQTSINDADFPDLRLLKQTIDKSVSEMPQQMRKVFEMSRYEGLKYAQIACLLNISVKTVEVHMGRALLKLRKSLIDYTPVISSLFLLAL